MSQYTQVIQLLTELTQVVNDMKSNAKTINELDHQSDLKSASKLHVLSPASGSQWITLQQIIDRSSSNYLGTYESLNSLKAIYPTAANGSRAKIKNNNGYDKPVFWDETSSEWIQSPSTQPLSFIDGLVEALANVYIKSEIDQKFASRYLTVENLVETKFQEAIQKSKEIEVVQLTTSKMFTKDDSGKVFIVKSAGTMLYFPENGGDLGANWNCTIKPLTGYDCELVFVDGAVNQNYDAPNGLIVEENEMISVVRNPTTSKFIVSP